MHTPSPQRSHIMAAVKNRNTGPEKIVASALRTAGIPFRQNAKNLPGTPDFLIPNASLALFVHGCWWHGHDCPRGSRIPKTNRKYWLQKVARNQCRDRRVTRQLREMGWSVWTVWECQLHHGHLPPRLRKAIKNRIDAATHIR